jgi:hypothetical protein
MTCWYNFFTRMKMTKKERRKGSDIIFEHRYAKSKILKTIKVDHINFDFFQS